MSKDVEAQVVIDKLQSETIEVPILGTTPLIMHKWSQKAKIQMLEAQQGKKKPRGSRDPQKEYEDSIYRTDDGYGFPALAFKAATVGAARFFAGKLTMVQTRQMLFFHGVPADDRYQLLVPIEGEPRMREDPVTIGRGSGELRFRAEFPKWSTTLKVTYITSSIDRGSVLSLIDAGGMGCGVGDWRPERGGEYGMFEVDPSRDVRVIG